MEKAKWRIRLILMIVVLTAVAAGCVYYWQNIRASEITEGVLITIMDQAPEGMNANESE